MAAVVKRQCPGAHRAGALLFHGSTAMLTTAQVAQVGHLAKQHGIGTKVGRDWIFTEQEVQRLTSRPKVGRPAKG